MNTAWLLGLALALVLVVGVAVLLLRRGRPVAPPPAVPAPPPRRQPAALRQAPVQPAAPTMPAGAAPAAGGGMAGDIDARRQATTEALRQARQRKAEEAARQEAERAAQARAAAAARPAASLPPPPASPRTQAGWASRPMDLGPPEPLAPRPVPTLVPKQPATPAPVAAQPERTVAPVQALSPPPLRPAALPRVPVVLVADDSKVVRVKTGRLLEKQGWQVLLADDGAAALQLLDSHVPDLLITDVEMPGLDGFALTRQVRGHARCARLPVIMITSSDDRHRAEAQAAGVDLLLGKPYAEETLLAQAQRLLGVVAPVLH